MSPSIAFVKYIIAPRYVSGTKTEPWRAGALAMIKTIGTNTRRIARAMALLAAIALAGETAFAQPSQDVSVASQPQNSIKLVRVVAALSAGAPWLKLSSPSLRGGLLQSFLCFHDGVTETWDGGRRNQDLPPYAAAFKSELDRAGYTVVTPGEDNLFDPQSGAADLQVAAVITDMKIEGCLSQGGDIRGNSVMKVDWQIYSAIKKQIVARASTSATAKLEESVPGGVRRLITESFAGNVRILGENADFRAAINAPKAFATGFQVPGQQSKIVLNGSLKAAGRPIADAVGSVVTILTGTGSGSGFLISDDGYMLTNAHVVGDDKEVRIRWSDRIETLAQVVRASKERDIAILKTNTRERRPLAIKRGTVNPTQRVYAIGSPRGEDFQGTISSGIVSADRVMNGLRYIQSDTTVSHGSSGGPLLDETGSVIGVTDLGIQNDGPAGLNLFIPIGDAMDFLSLEQH